MATNIYKIDDLEGRLLDEAVALAQGWRRANFVKMTCSLVFDEAGAYWSSEDEMKSLVHRFRPSRQWDDAGPVIEAAGVALAPARTGVGKGCIEGWRARIDDHEAGLAHETRAKAPLLAAMRCYVLSKFGESVSLG